MELEDREATLLSAAQHQKAGVSVALTPVVDFTVHQAVLVAVRVSTMADSELTLLLKETQEGLQATAIEAVLTKLEAPTTEEAVVVLRESAVMAAAVMAATEDTLAL